MTARMRAAVLFAGIGGWEIACEKNSVEVVWAAEWDDWKRDRYLECWPGATLYRDVAALDGGDLVERHGALDILLGSPPCTDISAANVSGCGIDGAESRYYIEAIRLARETGARWIGFENSPRLRTRGADRVCSLLGEAGYALWPCVVEAEDAGAPHERGRSFVLGCRRDAIEGSDAERARLWQQQGWRRWSGGDRTAELARHAGNAAGKRPEQAPVEVGARRAQQAVDGGSRAPHADADGEGQPDRAEHAEVGRRARADGGAGRGRGEAADMHGEQRRNGTGRSDGPQAHDSSWPTPCRSSSRARSEWQGVGGDPFEKLSPAQRAALRPWDNRGDGLTGYLLLAYGLEARLRARGLSERKVKSEMAKMRSALGDALVIPVVWAVVRSIVRTDAALVPVLPDNEVTK